MFSASHIRLLRAILTFFVTPSDGCEAALFFVVCTQLSDPFGLVLYEIPLSANQEAEYPPINLGNQPGLSLISLDKLVTYELS